MPDPAAARVWLTIGILDARAVRTLREILSGLATQPGIGLTIDLTTLDGQHHLTASALLSATARTMRGHDSTLTAHNPPSALTYALAAIPIATTHGQPPADSASHTHLHVGAAHPPAPAALTHTDGHGDQELQIGAQRQSALTGQNAGRQHHARPAHQPPMGPA